MRKKKTNIVLMVQSANIVFCYFNISPTAIREFEGRYGENSWKNSKLAIKVYFVENGTAKETKTVFIGDFSDSCYIDIDKGDQDVFVKLGKMFPDDTFTAFAISNTVSTPRNYESEDSAVYFIDTSESISIGSKSSYPIYKEGIDTANSRKEPKPYPFMDIKKRWNSYPKIMVSSGYCKNDFFNRYFDEVIIKHDLNSSSIK